MHVALLPEPLQIVGWLLTLLLTLAALTAAIPPLQVLFSWHSQYRAEKKWHIAGSWAAAGLTMLLLPAALKSSGAAGFSVFILCTMFVYGAYSLNQSYIVGLMGAERGMGGAIVNSLANFGGFVG